MRYNYNALEFLYSANIKCELLCNKGYEITKHTLFPLHGSVWQHLSCFETPAGGMAMLTYLMHVSIVSDTQSDLSVTHYFHSVQMCSWCNTLERKLSTQSVVLVTKG